MRVVGAFLMLGVLTIAVLTAVVVDDLIGARLGEGRGVPLGQPAEHVVVCGLGTVWLRVAEQLSAADVDVVGIERDPDPATYATMCRLGFPLIRGYASEEQTLLAVGVVSARCPVAVTRARRGQPGGGAGQPGALRGPAGGAAALRLRPRRAGEQAAGSEHLAQRLGAGGAGLRRRDDGA